MRVNGEVLGWVINHRAPPNFVVFTTAFVRKDFQRIGALFKLLVHSIVNIQNQGLCITFVTSVDVSADAAVHADPHRTLRRLLRGDARRLEEAGRRGHGVRRVRPR